MNIITISREFGSGGRELGKRMADELGYDYYDREIITAIARRHGLDERYVESTLNRSPQTVYPVTFGRSFALNMVDTAQNELLFEQKKIIDEIAAAGRNCIIVGRNADVLLREKQPFNIFVCAETEAKVRRCMERAEAGENLSERDILRNMRAIDKNRARTREILTDSKWGDRQGYHLIVNTTGWNMKALAKATAAFAASRFEAR